MPPKTPPGFTELVGLEFTEADAGFSRCLVDVTEEHLNPHGVVHGAVLYTLADTGMGSALYTELAEGETCATIEIKMNYLRRVESGRVVCETELVRKGRSIAYLESDLRHVGETVARATGSYSIFSG